MKLGKNQILLFGLTAHLIAAVFSIGYHQCDELFQVYEFAGYKLGLNNAGELPWEFHERMRSGIQPFIVYAITKVAYTVSIHNPFTIAFIVRLLQGLLSFLAIVKLLQVFEKELLSPKAKLWLWAFGLLFWCLPYFHVRFSAENFSATLFMFGFVMMLKQLQTKPLAVMVAGFLLGLSFVCRFQNSFLIAGLLGWLLFVNKTKVVKLLPVVPGALLALALGLLADKWLYGQWTLSWWNYVDLNLFKDKASQFGREPFYYYLGEALLQLLPPFSLIIVFCIVAFWIRFKTHVITWITLPFILLHCFVAHKELRFLFPVLNFLPFMVLYYFQSLQSRENKLLHFCRSKGFVRFAIVVNVAALLLFIFKPADNTSCELKKIYDEVKGENAVLLYEQRDPYNNAASLNYFRNTSIKRIDLAKDTLAAPYGNVYYFSDKFNSEATIKKQGKTFVKVYSSFPAWFSHLNFNGWLDRSVTFSIYKLQ